MDWAPVSQRIWDMKYRFRDPAGAKDEDLQATWKRVARALAETEKDPEAWAGRFEEALTGFKFLPAGRVIAGAGTGRTVTLFNCFVMGAIGDDMASIFDNVKEAALTMQQGGGIGHDFSTLRPNGAPVRGVGADASGPLSFMDVWDSMCRTMSMLSSIAWPSSLTRIGTWRLPTSDTIVSVSSSSTTVSCKCSRFSAAIMRTRKQREQCSNR